MLRQELAVNIPVGQIQRQKFETIIEDFYDDFDFHLYLRGQPGVGKTRYVKLVADRDNIILLHLEGNVTRWLFNKKLAVYLKNAGWPSANAIPGVDFDPEDLPKVVVAFDDVPTIFDPDFIKDLIIGLEEEVSDKIKYQTSLGGQYKQAEPYEREAIDHFRKDGEPGFEMNFYGRVKFIFMMNHALADEADTEAYKKHNKMPSRNVLARLESEAALHTRLQYNDIHLSKDKYWGWIADLVYNTSIVDGATIDDKDEMMTWLWDKWEALQEKSVRVVKQKLWKDLNKAKSRPDFDYKGRWENLIKTRTT